MLVFLSFTRRSDWIKSVNRKLNSWAIYIECQIKKQICFLYADYVKRRQDRIASADYVWTLWTIYALLYVYRNSPGFLITNTLSLFIIVVLAAILDYHIEFIGYQTVQQFWKWSQWLYMIWKPRNWHQNYMFWSCDSWVMVNLV